MFIINLYDCQCHILIKKLTDLALWHSWPSKCLLLLYSFLHCRQNQIDHSHKLVGHWSILCQVFFEWGTERGYFKGRQELTARLQSREALRNVLHPQLALVVCGTVTTNQPTSTTHYLLPTIPPSINIQIHCLPSTISQCSPSSSSSHNPLLTLSSPPWLDCSVIIPISKPAVTVPTSRLRQ